MELSAREKMTGYITEAKKPTAGKGVAPRGRCEECGAETDEGPRW